MYDKTASPPPAASLMCLSPPPPHFDLHAYTCAAPPRPADRSQKEQEWLLACGKELEARASPRWNSALESGAILCEELRNDRLSLAGPCICVCVRGGGVMYHACDARA